MAGNESNVDRVRDFWEKVLNQGHTNLIAEMLSPDYTFNGQHQSAADVTAWLDGIRKAPPDLHFTIADLFGAGDQVAIRWILLATNAKGERITATATNIVTLADGLAISNWQNPANPEPGPAGT